MKNYDVIAVSGGAGPLGGISERIGRYQARSKFAAVAEAERTPEWYGFWNVYGASSHLFAVIVEPRPREGNKES